MRPMCRHPVSLRLLGALVVVALPSLAVAQATFVDWSNDSGGLFTDGPNWQGGAAPDAQLEESPRFQAMGGYTVELPTDAPLEYAQLWAESGGPSSLVFQPADVVGDAVLSVTERTTIAGGLVDVPTIGLGTTASVHLATESLLVTGGGDLRLSGGSRLTASRVDVHAGESSPTQLLLQSDAPSELGEVFIGEAGDGTRDANLQIDNRGAASAGNISVGAVAQSGQTALLQVSDGASITQSGASRLTVGSGVADSHARVFVVGESELTTGGGPTTVASSGEIRNLGSVVNFNGPVTIDGGMYVEDAEAARAFAPGASVKVLDGGRMDLGEADLMLNEGRSLEIAGDDSSVRMDGDLVLGSSSTIDLTFDAAPPDDALIRVGCDDQCADDAEAQLAGALRVDFNPGQIPQLGATFPIVRAAAFSGEFATLDVDVPEPDQAWELATEGDTLWLTLVEAQQKPPSGDYNGDGVVDAADYVLWRDTLGSDVQLAADGDGDGLVDADDYWVWRNDSAPGGASLHPPAASAPEPGALPCCLLALCATLAARRRHA